VQTILILVGILAIIAIAGSVVWLSSGAMRELRKFGQTAEDVSHFLEVAEEEITNTTKEARSALSDVDRLVTTLGDTVERVDKVAAEVQRLMDIGVVATSTIRAVKSSTAGFASVYEGVKQGIKALYGSQQIHKGGTNDE